MGHGDKIILADAHFPGHSINDRVIRADGLKVTDLLTGILPLFELDQYVDFPAQMMEVVEGDTADPTVKADYLGAIQQYQPEVSAMGFIERFEFYTQAKDAFAIVMTSETRKYGNLMLSKGVTPVS